MFNSDPPGGTTLLLIFITEALFVKYCIDKLFDVLHG